MSKGYAKRYFASLGQFYATVRMPLRPFMHWPQWARDAYLDALTSHRIIQVQRTPSHLCMHRFQRRDPDKVRGLKCPECYEVLQ